MTDIEKYYQLMGCDSSVSDDELYSAYLQLRTKYQNDRFLEGEAGNEAARKLTELNAAYQELVEYRKSNVVGNNGKTHAFDDIDSLIKSGKIDEAQAALDNFNERNAEWHYLQSVVFYKKNWVNESKKQLEIAMQMDPSVEKYKNSYDKLCKQMNFNQNGNSKKDNSKNSSSHDWNKSGSGNNSGSTYEEPTEMMGGDSCMDYCCRVAICNMMLNCCCNCR